MSAWGYITIGGSALMILMFIISIIKTNTEIKKEREEWDKLIQHLKRGNGK